MHVLINQVWMIDRNELGELDFVELQNLLSHIEVEFFKVQLYKLVLLIFELN